MTLSPEDFAAFFREVHGLEPFPWQTRLLRQVAGEGVWPETLDLPTGTGKTAAIDIAVFHLALEADRSATRRAPVRIAFVVDRRLVVDDAFIRAQRLVEKLLAPKGPATARVAERLKMLSGDGPPLIARRLRGGIPREDDWARSPAQPTVLCSTVDQVGSRLLFRGYGVSNSMKPVHAGLIGSDCLILLDEAHLAEPFRQTLEWVRIYRGSNWRENEHTAPWGVAHLTATPGALAGNGFALGDEDRSHPVLKKRLDAAKPARLVEIKAKIDKALEAADDAPNTGAKDLQVRVTAIVDEVQRALASLEKSKNGLSGAVIGVVVNRVARARAVFDQLAKTLRDDEADVLLLIGPARPADRDDIAERLASIRTDAVRALEKPLILVATQCIEAGVDIDLDALVTELAPLDALRQRFGRLNRAGREFTAYATIIAAKADLAARADDPVYANTMRPAWDSLEAAAKMQGRDPIVDFGINAFAVAMEADALAPKSDAPVLLPAHLDLLSETSPIPAADPEVALYLHGPSRQPDSITVIWRADIDPDRHRDDGAIRRLLTLVPPRSAEAIQLPVWAVRRWLQKPGMTSAELADIAAAEPDERDGTAKGANRKVFRWTGNDDRSCWITPSDLRPGDAIVAPAHYGGADAFGWNPACAESALDIASKAAEPFAGRRFAVRVAPGLLGELVSDTALADALAAAPSQRWQDLRAAVSELALPSAIRNDLVALDDANTKTRTKAYLDLYGLDGDRPRGVVFVAPFGIKGRKVNEEGRPNTTEDDWVGSLLGFPLSLQQHSIDVEGKAERFASVAGLPAERVMDMKIAGFLHDAGKADPRFQAWLSYGDPLGPGLDEPGAVLAKSARQLPRTARHGSGLPANWRHEAFSVRLALQLARLNESKDPELVLWLVGVHHGYGRPFFPHQDPKDAECRALPPVLGLPSEIPPGPGPQSLAFDWKGLDWPTLFVRLKARYGVWELARMEAILRLADHRASEERTTEHTA